MSTVTGLNDASILSVALVRVLLALGLGAAVGLEREVRGRPAGLRTSAFICGGAALFTLVSQVLAHRFGGDPQRIASQIIPGIGFLGAGAVLRGRGVITGLTSAATVFIVASIGMAAGGGLYAISAASAALVLVVLGGFRWVEWRFRLKTTGRSFLVTGANYAAILADLAQVIETTPASLSYIRQEAVGDGCTVEFGVHLHAPDLPEFLRELRQAASIEQILPIAPTESEKD